MKKHLLLIILLALPLLTHADDSGTCGDNLTWTFNEATNTLTISGTGDMENYYHSAERPWYKHRKSIQKLVLEEGMTSIGQNAFYGCSNIIAVTIPNSVKTIGYYAFDECSSLTSMIIGTGVTSIDSRLSLKKAIWLTNTPPSGYNNIYNNSSVNYVANEQYSNNYYNRIVYPFLSSMFEVDGIRYVPVSPSERTCDAIDAVYDTSAANTNISSTVSYMGVAMTVQKVQPYLCYNNVFIENLNCDNNGDIAQYAFYGCKNMKTATLGQNITSIGNYAFNGCSSLESILIPNAVTSIGGYAFQKCSSLPLIRIPQAVTVLGSYAFSSCSSLKTVIIDNRENELKFVNNNVFSSCPLDSVYIGGNISYSTSQYEGCSPFYRNTTLRTVVITDKETEISANEFYGCTNLQNFTVGDGVTSFGDWAFSACSSLKSLAFGSKLQTIGKEAFSDCNSVTKIVSKAATPPTCGSQALDDINKWSCTLVVPMGSLAQYQAAEQWKEFFFIQEGEGGDSPSPQDQKCATPTISYANGKLTFSCETEGATCQSTITDSDITSYSSNEVQLGVTYHISVYATKAGLANSETATATLCWIDEEPRTEGVDNAVAQIRAHAMLIQATGGQVCVTGLADGRTVSVYGMDGMLHGTVTSQNGLATVDTTLPVGSIVIVKTTGKSIKCIMR